MDASLRLEQRWDVSVIVYGDTVRIGGDHALERVLETQERLFRQAIDQIDVNRAESILACRSNGVPRLRFVLHAMDRALHFEIEVLHAKTHALRTELM